MYQSFLKRFLDLIFASFVLLITSPIFVLVTILLMITNSGKPFFIQERPGKNEKIFKLIKFKTMNDDKDKNGCLLPDTKRLTAIGKFIRRTSLDEVPQLINVIKGEMSLIGPRPLLIKYLPYYSNEEKIRHKIRPGITGWAQINGRNLVNWDKRLAYDIDYVKNLGLRLDMKIILLTIYNVFISKNIVVDPKLLMKDLDEERGH